MDENIACEAAGAPNKFASPISRTGEMGIDWLAFLKWSIEGVRSSTPSLSSRRR